MTSLSPDLAQGAARRGAWRRSVASATTSTPNVQGRVPALDGLRGLMTLFVMVSHYFGEVQHGARFLCVGWVAVHMFFVMSGYLVGRLIIARHGSANFLPVFFIRRIARTFPIYFVCSFAIFGLLAGLGAPSWSQDAPPLPTWTYLTFLQNIFVVVKGSVGQPWLAPTWTLALEEQFYLVSPWLFLLVSRRWWLPVLLVVCGFGVAFRTILVLNQLQVAPLAILPSSVDVLAIGLVIAVLVDDHRIDWARWGAGVRALSIVCLFATALTQHSGPGGDLLVFQAVGPFLMAAGCGCFLLALLFGAPEAKRFHAPTLRFLGRISYAVYLTHLTVLGLLHGWVFGAAPDVATAAQVVVTLAALPFTILIAWILTEAVEQPLMRLAHGLRFS